MKLLCSFTSQKTLVLQAILASPAIVESAATTVHLGWSAVNIAIRKTECPHGQVEQGGKTAKPPAPDAASRTPLGAGSAVRAAILDGSGSPGAGPPGAGQVRSLPSLKYLLPLHGSLQTCEQMLLVCVHSLFTIYKLPLFFCKVCCNCVCGCPLSSCAQYTMIRTPVFYQSGMLGPQYK